MEDLKRSGYYWTLLISMWPNALRIVVSNLASEPSEYKFLDRIDETTVDTCSALDTSLIHMASLASDVALMNYLLTLNPSVNVQNEHGETPLHWACKQGNVAIIEALLTHGANISIIDADWNSPLHWLAEYNHIKAVEFLSQGYLQLSNLIVKNVESKTPIEVAEECENIEMAKLLGEIALSFNESKGNKLKRSKICASVITKVSPQRAAAVDFVISKLPSSAV